MGVLHLTDKTFQETIEQTNLPVLVDFWASWCNPCKMLAPVIEEIAAEMDGKALVCKVDIDENNELASKFGIMSIPTLLYFKDGAIVNQTVGVLPKQAILDALKTAM